METTEIQTITRPIKPTITLEEFEKLDIRICMITGVERVPKTDKLYKLNINTGVDERIVVSAIADKVKIENLLYRNVAFILNLAPRTIKGIESNGMIIMSEGNDFFLPVSGMETGAIVI